MTSTAASQASNITAGTVAIGSSTTCSRTLDVSSNQTCDFALHYDGSLAAAVKVVVAVTVGSVPLGTPGVNLGLENAAGQSLPVVDGSETALGNVSDGWREQLAVTASIDATTMVLHAGESVGVKLTVVAATGANSTGFTASVVDDAIFGISNEAQVPDECRGAGYNIVVLTDGADIWPPAGSSSNYANHRNLVFGLGGDDRLRTINSGDCVVGGSGDDTLIGGNGKDFLFGGPGDDYLQGANGKDYLNGGDDFDRCIGGHAPDGTFDCESYS